MPTRSRTRKTIEVAEAQREAQATEATHSEAPSSEQQTGIMRNSDMLAELRSQREEIVMLAQRAAAAEERAYNLAATLRWLQDEHKKDVTSLQEAVSEAKHRLGDVEKHGRRLFKSMRNHLRTEREQQRETEEIEQQEPQNDEDVKIQVDEDSRSTVSSVSSKMRAEALVQHLDDARSEVGSTVSRGLRFW